MIKFERRLLSNGLKVLVHVDRSTPFACMNILYDVGARDEDADKTGFAHLFEHLMFGGSVNIPSYDTPLQRVGGDNNAFTTNDITNYYLNLPAANLETGFWLESDRMLSLAFSDKSLEVQRNVVIEEFKQRYLNQPYGDEWLLLRPLAYNVHPYRWATIGKELAHIEQAQMQDVRSFFNKYYCPSNAILVVAGNVDVEQVFEWCDKWFAPIPAGVKPLRSLPAEPEQTEARFLHVERDVPADSIYKVFHMVGRTNKRYTAQDLLSDVLGRGSSSRLFQKLVKENELFTDVNAYVTGSLDPGLFVFSGKLKTGVSLDNADSALQAEIASICQHGITDTELEKVKNKAESTLVFGEMSSLNKAMNLAYAELMGDAELINKEADAIRAVTAAEIKAEANALFRAENCSTLHYAQKK
jgi:zinc protease